MSVDMTVIMAPKWDSREPACSTAYICQRLRSLGRTVQYLDYNIELYDLCRRLGMGDLWTDPVYHQGWVKGAFHFLAAFLDIDRIQGDVVGFSVTATNRDMSLLLARMVRARFPRKKVIFGGYALYYHTDLYGVSPGAVDAICMGEGEHTLRDVLDRDFKNLEEVPGLYLPDGDGWCLTAPRPLIQNLDEIAWPTFEEVDLALYDVPDLPLVGSPGRIGRCVFCNDRHRTPGYRTRSATHQVDELEYLKKRYDTQFFVYNDPLMNGSVKVLEEKADEILRRGLSVDYGGNLMAHRGMKPELFQKLRRSGLSVAIIGLESGCNETLGGMNKYHTEESAAEFLRNCHDAGMRVEINIIVGFPTETEEHFQATIRFIERNRNSIDCVVSVATFHVAYSDLWKRRGEFGIEMEDHGHTAEWRTRDGRNTLDIRLDRLNRFQSRMRELGLSLDRSDRAVEQKCPDVSGRFLKTYLDSLGEEGKLSAEERNRAPFIGRDIQGRMRRAALAKALGKVGVLDQAVWMKRTLARVLRGTGSGTQ